MSGVLLITGGSRGIGAATARIAAERGRDLAINYRADREAAETVVAAAREAGVEAAAFQADVADEGDVQRLFEQVERDLGPLGALVNSAGVTMPPTAVAEAEVETLTRLMAVNVVGTMLCCREAARRLSKRRGRPGGAIVNLSSMAAPIGGRPGASHYAASKAAVDAFTVGFAREVADDGVRVNALRPGMTMTDMTDRVRRDPALREEIAATIAMNRVATAEEMAYPILWLLSDEASFVSGCLLEASGGGFVIGPRPDAPE